MQEKWYSVVCFVVAPPKNIYHRQQVRRHRAKHVQWSLARCKHGAHAGWPDRFLAPLLTQERASEQPAGQSRFSSNKKHISVRIKMWSRKTESAASGKMHLCERDVADLNASVQTEDGGIINRRHFLSSCYWHQVRETLSLDKLSPTAVLVSVLFLHCKINISTF